MSDLAFLRAKRRRTFESQTRYIGGYCDRQLLPITISSPKVRYKIGCYGVTASVGVALNFPVNVNLGLESLPSAGKIFNGYFRSISNIEDFAGRYTVVGANAGVFANMTTALLFVGRNISKPGIV